MIVLKVKTTYIQEIYQMVGKEILVLLFIH